jgi:hypothetical protein
LWNTQEACENHNTSLLKKQTEILLVTLKATEYIPMPVKKHNYLLKI